MQSELNEPHDNHAYLSSVPIYSRIPTKRLAINTMLT
jgi:hypothetical protein